MKEQSRARAPLGRCSPLRARVHESGVRNYAMHLAGLSMSWSQSCQRNGTLRDVTGAASGMAPGGGAKDGPARPAFGLVHVALCGAGARGTHEPGQAQQTAHGQCCTSTRATPAR